MNQLVFIAQLSLDFIFSHLDEMPGEGEEVLSKGFSLSLGGGTLVYPIVLNRLGINCRVILAKSRSIHSDLAYKLLLDQGINNIDAIEVDDFDPVMTTAVLSFEKERSFVSHNDERAFHFSDDFLFEQLKSSKVVFATERNLILLPRLKEAGCIVVFDLGWSDTLNLDQYSSVFPYVDYFTPNEKEAKKITGTSTVEESLRILKTLVPFPIVSCGEKGCRSILDDGRVLQVSIPGSISAVDTTGAGDNFMAGLIYGIYSDLNIIECLKLANCTGALSTTGYGCYEAEYSLEDLLSKISEVKVDFI